jgi:carboxyl-terminal processing protease
MNRERFAWIVCTLVICALAFNLPGTFAQRDDDYAFVKTLVDVERQVAANYVDDVDEARLRQAAIDGMLSELDPYSVFVPPTLQEGFDRMLEGTFTGVGILINEREDGAVEVVSPIEGSPAFKAGVLAGDIIIKVNGESMAKMRAAEVTKRIAGKLGTPVNLTVRHSTGEEVELTIMREEIHIPTVKGFKRNADNSWNYFVAQQPKIAYLRVTQFTPDTFKDFEPAVRHAIDAGAKGLILDLRFNPGGLLDQARQMVDLFVEKGVIVATRGRNRTEETYYAKEEGTLSNIAMVVLVNEHSASAAEIVAGSLKDHGRATIVGTRSYGKGSVQEVIPLDPDEGELKLTTAYYYLPSGRLVHRKKDATDWGVDPQIEVKLTENAEKEVERELANAELMRGGSSRPATTRATTGAATEPVDAQLEAAVNTLVGRLVLRDRRSEPSTGASSSTAPTTQPATLPAVR